MHHEYGASINDWFMNRVTIGIVAGLLLIVLFGWQRSAIQSLESDLALANQQAEQLRQKRDELATDLAESEASKDELIAELKHREAVLATRDAALSRSRQELAELSEKLRGLRKTDEEYKTWSDARVPDSVIRLLRNARNSGNSENRIPESAGTGEPD
jgi:septal ring factor EnvC (AmiA/AmiB activator)